MTGGKCKMNTPGTILEKSVLQNLRKKYFALCEKKQIGGQMSLEMVTNATNTDYLNFI
jgi:hypothetical protein